MKYYNDLREYIDFLQSNGHLVRIKRKINKDTELQPLVRWQFRGLPEKERKAFLFENVTDVKGKKYNGSVLVGAHAASRKIYAVAMGCKLEEIMARWTEAQLHPIAPKVISSGPVHEEVHVGDNLLEHGGLEEFPIPLSTPEFDNAPYFTAANWVSKDLDTGAVNVGNYRGMVKNRLKTGCDCRMPQHMRQNWAKYKARGIPMPVAVFLGATPNLGMVAVTKFPYGKDEYALAGGISREPVELVKCITVDLEVPATAEVVLEGEIPTDALEREGPFGEYTGYMGLPTENLIFNIKCITHRKNPVWNTFISQFPPSESSVIKGVGTEAAYFKLLKYDLGIDTLVDVGLHGESGTQQFCVISLKRTDATVPWKALNGAVALDPGYLKWVIVVDDDIDPHDPDSYLWALCWRVQPDKDIRITPGKSAALDPSAVPPEEHARMSGYPPTTSILIDATRKWAYPPTSLPGKKFMETARRIWEEEELPELTPKVPWYGYSLGYWTKELEEEAALALKGEHYKTGEKIAKEQKKI
ncbi:MAG: UbiD family decarboxylase [Desulfobacterales bacterium]|nr:UbiD family decarboxylase [Desulfobacterales bacterium]